MTKTSNEDLCLPAPSETENARLNPYIRKDTCLLNNNCLVGGTTDTERRLTPTQKKSAEALRLECNSLVVSVGIDRLLFITLTFSDPLPDRGARETIYEQFKKLILLKIFNYGFTVFDRSETGRPHYHIIGVGGQEISYRAGFDIKAWDASIDFEKRWNRSGHTDFVAEQQWRVATGAYTASASSDLRSIWSTFAEASARHGFGRINAIPVKDAVACSFYLAKCITNGFRDNHPDDRGVRRVRFWGKYPRKVSMKFSRITKGATRWRGKLAFCARILGFEEFDDFAKRFGPRWFIYMKGIIRLVPNRVAEASLLTPHIRLDLDDWERQRVRKVDVELHDRLERYGLGGRSVSEQKK